MAVHHTVLSQTKTLNQFDADGKKHGQWVLYLDEYGNKTNDSIEATYYRYTHYDHGIHTQPMGGFIPKTGKIEAPSNQVKNNKPILLDGEYKCLDKKGRILYCHVFHNGNYVSYKEYYTTGELHKHFDYTTHCTEQEHSWYMYIYSKDGKEEYRECIMKDEFGNWPKMKG